MPIEKFQNKYRISSARATWHDYNGGVYFVTICTKNGEHFFGKIKNGAMQFTEIGQFVNDNLQDISKHYSYAEIPLFVVMPNHIHAIVFIDADEKKKKGNESENGYHCLDCHYCHHCWDCCHCYQGRHCCCRDVARYVSTVTTDSEIDKYSDKNKKMSKTTKRQSLLGFVVRGLKSALTKFANQNQIRFVWQTRFHDRIIRDQDEINRIAEYIENNPITWETDCLNNNK